MEKKGEENDWKGWQDSHRLREGKQAGGRQAVRGKRDPKRPAKFHSNFGKMQKINERHSWVKVERLKSERRSGAEMSIDNLAAIVFSPGEWQKMTKIRKDSGFPWIEKNAKKTYGSSKENFAVCACAFSISHILLSIRRLRVFKAYSAFKRVFKIQSKWERMRGKNLDFECLFRFKKLSSLYFRRRCQHIRSKTISKTRQAGNFSRNGSSPPWRRSRRNGAFSVTFSLFFLLKNSCSLRDWECVGWKIKCGQGNSIKVKFEGTSIFLKKIFKFSTAKSHKETILLGRQIKKRTEEVMSEVGRKFDEKKRKHMTLLEAKLSQAVSFFFFVFSEKFLCLLV